MDVVARWEEAATQKGPGLESSLGPSYCEAAVINKNQLSDILLKDFQF